MTYDEIIYNQALKDGIPQPLAVLIVAQARHETGNYTSNVFKSCNNAFGYKWVGQSTAIGPCSNSPEGNAYAKYMSIEQSTHELTLWIKRRMNDGKFPADLSRITTADNYAQLLKNAGYYGDTVATYTNGLIAALQKIGDLATSGAGRALFFIIALGLIYYRKRIFG